MSTPLTATWRIVQPYTIQSQTHRSVVYVRNAELSGGVYKIHTRATDALDLDWALADNALVESMSYQTPTGAAFADAVLQQLSGIVWVPIATHTPSFTDHSSGSYTPGSQSTLVLRDTLFRKVRHLVMEGNQAAPWHAVTLASMTTSEANYCKQFTSSFSLTNAPYNWMVGRGNTYLSTASLVGHTMSLNKKLRRRRGLT